MYSVTWLIAAASLILLLLYIRINDKKLLSLPEEANEHSPVRVTPEAALVTAKHLIDEPIRIQDYLPPTTGRRYIIIGGAGFLGGWIVKHLVERGEDPRKIRVIDIRAPTRPDLISGPAAEVDFQQVDIADAQAVKAAFLAPWPEESLTAPLTVFHSAANIRFFERSESVIDLSTRVNVRGTQNIIDASRAAGASILVYTSSGSITVRSTLCWLWPWQKQPERVVQLLGDDSPIPTRHRDFFSNYAASKSQAERLVRSADKSSSGSSILRTGCIRPGNGVYGTGGDTLCGALLVRRSNQTWMQNVLQSFIYVENCSLAHLAYEARLVALEQGGRAENGEKLPDIGGDAFTVADAGPPATYGDVYRTLETLTDGDTTFSYLSPTIVLFIAQLVEAYYLTRHWLVKSSSSVARFVGRWIPPVKGDILGLQPSAFVFTIVHLIFDDSRARLPPERGGLGYNGPWTTLQGLCKLVEEHEKGGRRAEERSLTLGLGMDVAPRVAQDLREKLPVLDTLAKDAVSLVN